MIRAMGIEATRAEWEFTGKAFTILQYAHESAQAFFEAFGTVREARGAGRGATTDEEQDLLRAMLLFAAAGLDSMTKQLIRDCLPRLVETDATVRTGLEKFIVKQVSFGPEGALQAGAKFLARILAAEHHQEEVIEAYVHELTGASLQSGEELAKAAAALGLEPRAVDINPPQLKPIFQIRNKIVHELDINFDAPRRNRQTRRRNDMTGYANTLLDIGEKILTAVDDKLAE